MSNSTRSVLIGALAAAMLASAPAQARDQEPIMVTAGAAIKGVQAVTIGAFNVGFIFQSLDSAKTTGGLDALTGGATSAKSRLAGVTPAMMQAITDAAYTDFKARLAASGFAVADSAPLFSSEGFRKVKLTPAPYDANILLDKRSTGKATYLKPTELPGQFMLPGDITASGMSGMGLMFSMGTNAYGVAMAAKATNSAVIDVTYLIDFSELKRPGAFSMTGLKVNSGMSVVANYSRVSLVTPVGKTAVLTIGTPVAVDGDFADKADTTKGAGLRKVANIFGAVSGGLSGGLSGALSGGGMKFGNDKTFTFTAKPSWQTGATKAATLANARVVEQLATLR